MRIAVNNFAELMEKVLQDNDEEKGSNGWLNEDIDWLFKALTDEVKELMDILIESKIFRDNIPDTNFKHLIEKECADVANFAMMIYDRIQ